MPPRAVPRVLAFAFAFALLLVARAARASEPDPMAAAPAPAAFAPVASAPAPAAPPDDDDTDHPRSYVDIPRLALGAGGHIAFGSAPAVAVGLRISAELATSRWSLGLEGRVDHPATADTTATARVRTRLAGGGFVPCLRAQAIWACGVVFLSRLGAEGFEPGVPIARHAAFFLGVGGRVEMHFALPRDFALRVGGELLAHPISVELMAGDHQVFKSSVLSTTLMPTIVRAF